MSSEQLKILVCGDVEGQFKSLFKRVSSVLKKSPGFEVLFCVGNFFDITESARADWKLCCTGELQVPLPLFVLGPNKQEHEEFYTNISESGELCNNITYLGDKGVYTGASGLTVAYLSGVQSTREDDGVKCSFSCEHVSSLITSCTSVNQGVDILLTSQWPRSVSQMGNPTVVDTINSGSTEISRLAVEIKPRYHFSGLQGVSYERVPYRNHTVLAQTARHITRFIALANVANTSKSKFLYAFNVTPMKCLSRSALIIQTPDTTECPYKTLNLINKSASGDNSSVQYFYNLGQTKFKRKSENWTDNRSSKISKTQQKHSGPPAACWFCLASPDVDKSLIVSIGESVYMALAKGALVPDHVLILPIGHYQSTLVAPDDVLLEINKLKASLRRFYNSQGKACVIYERNYKSSHLQLQVIPVPLSKLNLVKEIFIEMGSKYGIEFTELSKFATVSQIVQPGVPYFYVELEDGSRLIAELKSYKFPLNFGREVLASERILNMPERADWRGCAVTKDEEQLTTEKFRAQFQPYDPTVDNDDNDD